MSKKLIAELENAGKVDRAQKAMLQKIKELDEETIRLITLAREKTEFYCKNKLQLEREAENKLVKEIHQLHVDIEKKNLKKQEIADDMYEFMDKAIQRMDDATTEKKKELKAAFDTTEDIVLPVEPMLMPVNPHEPTYCTCKQVASDEMIACDNPNCKYEWFHYKCVGITEAPEGEWYCADCKKLQPKQAPQKNEKNHKKTGKK